MKVAQAPVGPKGLAESGTTDHGDENGRRTKRIRKGSAFRISRIEGLSASATPVYARFRILTIRAAPYFSGCIMMGSKDGGDSNQDRPFLREIFFFRRRTPPRSKIPGPSPLHSPQTQQGRMRTVPHPAMKCRRFRFSSIHSGGSASAPCLVWPGKNPDFTTRAISPFHCGSK